jgi:hypothetical protein
MPSKRKLTILAALAGTAVLMPNLSYADDDCSSCSSTANQRCSLGVVAVRIQNGSCVYVCSPGEDPGCAGTCTDCS